MLPRHDPLSRSFERQRYVSAPCHPVHHPMASTTLHLPSARHRHHHNNQTRRHPAASSRRCSTSPARCFTGLRSLFLTVPPGLTGGAFVDTPVKQGWLYVVKAKVFHENEATLALAPGVAGAEGGAGASAEPGALTAERKGSVLATVTNWAAGRKGSAKAEIATRLVLWDMRDGKEMSATAVKTGEWEVSGG